LLDVLVVVVTPAFVWVCLMVLLFLVTTNRLKPPAANHSSALRIFFVCFVCAALLIALAMLKSLLPTLSDDSFGMFFQIFTALGVFVLAAAIITFGSEPVILSKRQTRVRWRTRGWKAPLRLFLPGGESGAALGLLVAAGATLTFFTATRTFLIHGSKLRLDVDKTVSLLGELCAESLSFLVFIGLLALVARILISSRKAAVAVAVVVSLGLLTLPLAQVVYQMRIDNVKSTIWNAHYLSPAVAFADSWMRWYSTGHRSHSLVQSINGRQYPLALIGSLVYVLASVMLAMAAITLRFWAKLPGPVRPDETDVQT